MFKARRGNMTDEEKEYWTEEDYQNNLNNAKIWTSNIEKIKPEEIKITTQKGDVQKENCLIISFNPPQAFGLGNFAQPVSFYQNQEKFKQTVVASYKLIKNHIQAYRNRAPSSQND